MRNRIRSRSSRKPPKFWTPQELATLVRLKNEGCGWDVIAAHPHLRGRSHVSMQSKWHAIAHHESRIAPDGSTRDRETVTSLRQRAEQARAAMPQHVDLTAQIMGDPLPGRSALDRQGRQPRRSISLAPVNLGESAP